MFSTEMVIKKMGGKLDQGKPDVSLIEPEWLLEVSKVLTFGAEKYSKDNWKLVDDARDRYLSAAYRHLLAYHGGELVDSESGLSHLAHASCCLMFLQYLSSQNEVGQQND